MLAWLEFKFLGFCEQNGMMATTLGQIHRLFDLKIL